jgi:hypothetical protein
MPRKLIKQIQELAADLKEEAGEAKKLIKERPEDAAYFTGLHIGRTQAYIAIETLLEKRDEAGEFVGESRGVTIDGSLE